MTQPTDLATAIVETMASRPKFQPGDPVPVDVSGQHPTLTRNHYVWQAWRENSDWDGQEIYEDLDTAMLYAALDYAREEYPEPDPDADEDDQPAAPTALVWVHVPGCWELHDGDHDTAVRINISAVYGPAAADVLDEAAR